MMQEPEDLARIYSAAMDSVNLINDYAAKPQPLDEDDKATVKRNVDHLEIIVAKPYWAGTEYDMTPLNDAIVTGKQII